MKKKLFIAGLIGSLITFAVCLFAYKKKKHFSDDFFDFEDEELDDDLDEGGCVRSCHAKEAMGL